MGECVDVAGSGGGGWVKVRWGREWRVPPPAVERAYRSPMLSKALPLRNCRRADTGNENEERRVVGTG